MLETAARVSDSRRASAARDRARWIIADCIPVIAAGMQQREMKALVASLREVSQALEQSLSERILELAVEIARVVVRHALEVRPEFVIDVVREAVASLPEMEAHAEIALHPDDAVLLREVLRSDPNAALPWHVVEDPQINRGGCRVVTRSSEIDATLDSRWRRVVASLGRDERWFPAPAAGRKTDSPSDG